MLQPSQAGSHASCAFSLAYPEAHMIALAGFGEKKRNFVWAVE